MHFGIIRAQERGTKVGELKTTSESHKPTWWPMWCVYTIAKRICIQYIQDYDALLLPNYKWSRSVAASLYHQQLYKEKSTTKLAHIVSQNDGENIHSSLYFSYTSSISYVSFLEYPQIL